MSKHPLSPEILMSATMFGEGGESPTPVSGIIDFKDCLVPNPGEDVHKIGYYDTAYNKGLCAVSFTASANNATLSIDYDNVYFSEIYYCSCDCTGTTTLTFSNYEIGDVITICGGLGYNGK